MSRVLVGKLARPCRKEPGAVRPLQKHHIEPLLSPARRSTAHASMQMYSQLLLHSGERVRRVRAVTTTTKPADGHNNKQTTTARDKGVCRAHREAHREHDDAIVHTLHRVVFVRALGRARAQSTSSNQPARQLGGQCRANLRGTKPNLCFQYQQLSLTFLEHMKVHEQVVCESDWYMCHFYLFSGDFLARVSFFLS